MAAPKDTLALANLRFGKGGTWYTVRYAIRQGKPVKVIDLDGSVSDL